LLQPSVTGDAQNVDNALAGEKPDAGEEPSHAKGETPNRRRPQKEFADSLVAALNSKDAPG